MMGNAVEETLACFTDDHHNNEIRIKFIQLLIMVSYLLFDVNVLCFKYYNICK